MKKNTLTLFLSLLIISVFSQNRPGGGGGGGQGPGMTEEMRKMMTDSTGVVMGMVLDDKSGKALEYATIAVFNPKDSALINGGITDENGRFSIGKIPFGNILIRIDFIGYQSLWIDDKVLEKDKKVLPLGRVKVQPSAAMLEGVEISATKEMIQTNLDKKVFNVSQDLTSMGGSAIDVMQTIPAVQVDIDGNLTIRGTGNITILIDGRPSNLTLEQIPAETIETIEVITNPSARYDPDGISGIINVVLKKQKEHGFNGMLTANLGIGEFDNVFKADKSNITLNLNYRYDKINLGLSYDNRTYNNRFKGDLYRKTTFDTVTSLMNQEMLGKFKFTGQNIRMNADYFLNKYTTLFVNGSVGIRDRDRNFNMQTDIRDGMENIQQAFSQVSTSQGGSINYEIAGGFKRTFETKGKEWTVDLLYSTNTNDDLGDITQDYSSGRTFYQNTIEDGTRTTINLQTDFVTPIGNGGRLETGYKFANRQIGNDYSLYSGINEANAGLDSNQLNNFVYTDYLHSAYVIYSNTLWEKFKYQGGLRIENADIISDLKSADEVYKHTYLNVFPTAHIRYEITEKNAFQLSYSRRVSRPNIHVLNPFVDYSDRFNLRKGNPELDPEFVNSLELSHYIFINKTSINSTVFYRKRTDIISRFTTLLNDSTTMMTYANVDKSTSYGAELVVSQTLSKWWKLTATGSFYNNSYDSQIAIDPDLQKDFNWNTRLMSIFNFNKIGDFQVIFNYRSPMVTIGTSGFARAGVGQGRMQETYSMDFGGRVNLWKDDLQLRLRVSDMFAWWKMEAETNAIDVFSRTTRQRESRVFWIGISYKFNDYKARRDRPRINGEDNGEEM